MALTRLAKKFAVAGTAGLGLLALILVFANALGSWFYARWDMTAHSTYSLSPSSRQWVRKLQEPVVIKAFFSPDLPPPYTTYARYTKDILTEYRSASHGKIRFEFVPAKDPQEFAARASEAGMLPVQFTKMASDQLQVQQGFMGLSIFYRDRSETVPVIDSVEGLEYTLTSRIVKMTRENKKVIAFTTGHGEPTWKMRRTKLFQDLSALYEIHDVALPLSSTGTIVADALVVFGPSLHMDDKSLGAIDQAVKSGIPTAFLIDETRVLLQQFSVSPLSTGLEDLLQRYGVKLGNRLVLDPQCETVAMTQQAGYIALTSNVRYAFIPSVNHFGSTQPLLREIETLSVPFTVRNE